MEELFDDDESGYCWLVGTIDNIDLSDGWMYISCKKCARKLIKVEQEFFCEKCSKYDSSATLRYIIKVWVKDDTGRAPFLLWDRECTQAIGQAAVELKKDVNNEESNCISIGDESKAMKDKAGDVALMETPSSKGVGEEWSDDGHIKRSLNDAFSATGQEKKRKVYIKKEKD